MNRYRMPHPFAPPRPGGTPLAELIDRHAHLVAVGLANCRAAQALHKEITRRKQAALCLPSRAPLSNDDNDDHYNPQEHRDGDGKWTTGPNASGSKTNNSSQTSLIAKIGQGFKFAGKAIVAAAAELGSEFTGQAAADRIDARLAWEEAEDSVPWTDEEWGAVHQAIISNDTKKLQELIDAHNAKVAQAAERNPLMPLPDNMSQLMSGDEDLRAESDLKLLPTPLQVMGRASQGFLESTPKIGAVAALQGAGIPTPISAGLVFGTTEQGFDFKQAIIAAAVPVVGEYAEDITKAIAVKAGVSNEFAKQIFSKMGGAGGMTALIGTDQLNEIWKQAPDKRKAALIQIAAIMGTLFIIGMAGHGESSQPEEPGGNVGPEKPIPKPPADLQPYGGSGGGHHIPAKSAFREDPNYDMDEALAMPNSELDRLGSNHRVITGAQKILYTTFAKTGQKLDWPDIERIETEALVRGGIQSETTANEIVKEAISALKAKGVKPTRIPWGN